MVLLQIGNSVEKVVDYTLLQYGALGLLVLILTGALYLAFRYMDKKENSHIEERREMRAEFAKQHSEALEVTKSVTEAMNDIKTMVTVIKEGRSN